ncbi:MAG TPA: hypothetical protein VF631_13965 [Allosphingosinicella sp.]|uniref:hypothetical protein n=1 Tax=Allosphingosinicella sp. TaxID=2823234 RepID=UPI002F29BC12
MEAREPVPVPEPEPELEQGRVQALAPGQVLEQEQEPGQEREQAPVRAREQALGLAQERAPALVLQEQAPVPGQALGRVLEQEQELVLERALVPGQGLEREQAGVPVPGQVLEREQAVVPGPEQAQAPVLARAPEQLSELELEQELAQVLVAGPQQHRRLRLERVLAKSERATEPVRARAAASRTMPRPRQPHAPGLTGRAGPFRPGGQAAAGARSPVRRLRPFRSEPAGAHNPALGRPIRFRPSRSWRPRPSLQAWCRARCWSGFAPGPRLPCPDRLVAARRPPPRRLPPGLRRPGPTRPRAPP